MGIEFLQFTLRCLTILRMASDYEHSRSPVNFDQFDKNFICGQLILNFFCFSDHAYGYGRESIFLLPCIALLFAEMTADFPEARWDKTSTFHV